jgi:hypothetical protein
LIARKRVAVSGNSVPKSSIMLKASNTTCDSSMTRSRARAISGTSAKSPSTMMAPAMPLATCTSAEPW